ncbi:MAG TPA: hypothetical protein DDZ81_11910 [Acetobacteraceae bacterium]|jgi:hypothetical protein|nr:hypothetical protein [Acetobacteraceae bacterium]
MEIATSRSAPWAGADLWPAVRRAPFVVVLSGINRSEIVDAALADPALNQVAMPRSEPGCSAPCDALLWRLETATGEGLNQPGLLARHWHRRPYAMTLRLVRYQPGSTVPEILDEGTLGTRGPYLAFAAAVDRLAMRFVRDAALGRGRGPADMAPASAPHGMPGWLDATMARWQERLMTEWWSIGFTTASMERVFSGGGLGALSWYRAEAGHRYLADPFPWPGTNRILCEEMPLWDGVGRIVSVGEANGALTTPAIHMDDGYHHSYPNTFSEDGTVYCVPESTERGMTRIHHLHDDGTLEPVCDVAPHAKLADPTLFRWAGRYWLACTDLDLGNHDNLCLMHAPAVTGPWAPHARWPVKIDIRGARPAGMVFNLDGRLFRPAQDCAETYGAGIAIHEVLALTETDFRELPVAQLRPDSEGPFPHGLHTLAHDGERFWVDGKRFVLDLGQFRRKLLGRASKMFS